MTEDPSKGIEVVVDDNSPVLGGQTGGGEITTGVPTHHNASFTADQEAAAAEAEAAAAKRDTPLPKGVTAEQMAALEAAGYSVKAPEKKDPEGTTAVENLTPEQIRESLDGPTKMTPEAFTTYATELSEKGELSQESYDTISKTHNVSKEVIDLVVDGINARASVTAQDALAEVGATMSDFHVWSEWSRGAETDSVREERIKQLTSTNATQRGLALQALRGAYNDAVGKEPKLMRGSPTPGPGAKSFDDILTEAMSDARYHRQDDVGDRFRKQIYGLLEKKGY